MDYTKRLRHLSKRAVYSYRCYARCAAFLSAALLIGLPLGAQAAVLKINPGDNAGNAINVSGELSASVTHTADGMTIEIPGVEISLVCDTQTDPDACTVTIGSGSSSSGSGSSSSGSGSSSSGSGSSSSDSGSSSSGSGSSSSGSGSSSSDSGDDDTACDPAFDFGCQDGTLGGTGSSSGSGDTSDSGDSGGSTGYTSPTTTATASSDDDDPCKGTGYRPNCNATTTVAAQGAFPTGGARRVANFSGSYDYGSAKGSGKDRIEVASGTVAVVGLSMSSGSSPSSGGVVFAQAGNISGVALRAWISSAPDGPRVSACSYVGYAEGVLNFSINGNSGCNLSAGSNYYFNMALCTSSGSDLYCNQSGALAAPTGGIISVTSNYND